MPKFKPGDRVIHGMFHGEVINTEGDNILVVEFDTFECAAVVNARYCQLDRDAVPGSAAWLEQRAMQAAFVRQ